MRKRTGKWFMLRVTDRKRDQEAIYVDVILKNVETYACAEEPHDNTDNYHYHSIHQKQKSTLKDRLVLKQWTGNEHHAFSQFIEDTEDHWRRCLCYISKGPSRGTFPKILKNSFEFSNDMIWLLHYEWWDKWAHTKIPEASKQAKINRFNLIFNSISKDSFIEGAQVVAQDVMQYYQDNDMLEPNDFQLKCYVKSLIRKHIAIRTSRDNWECFKRRRAREIIGGEFTYDDFMRQDELPMDSK